MKHADLGYAQSFRGMMTRGAKQNGWIQVVFATPTLVGWHNLRKAREASIIGPLLRGHFQMKCEDSSGNRGPGSRRLLYGRGFKE